MADASKRRRLETTASSQLVAYESSEESVTSELHEISSRAQAYAPHVRAALEAFWILDPEAEVHGSHQLGLWDEESDVDLLASKPLVALLRQVRGSGSLKLLEYVSQARVPRLLLKHHKSQVVLDVVEAIRDPDAAAKDHFIARQLAANVEVAPLAQRIKAFVRSEGQQLPRNFFLFLLMGLWFLAHGNPPHVDEDGKCQQGALFQGWLSFLVDSVAKPLTFDLRDPPKKTSHDEGRGHWKIIEPVSGRTACSLSQEQVQHLAELVMEYRKHQLAVT